MNKIIIAFALLTVVGCSSKSKKDADIKDQNIQTMNDKSETLMQGVTLGVDQNKDLVVQEKVQLNEHLRQLASSIKHKQDELYGSKRFSTRGLYGKLESCVAKTPGSTLVARSIVVQDQELGQLEAGKFGYDEKGRIVALDEVKLRDKIRDLEAKKLKLYEKEEELIAELNRCESAKQ